MLTDREIVAAMREANPFPEPELLSMDPSRCDVLLEKISERRVPMLSTPDIRTETNRPDEAEPMAPAPKRFRKPAVVLVSFILMLVAVGIGALIFLGGGADTASQATTTTTASTIPATTVPGVAPTTLVPVSPVAGEFITYGPDQGVTGGCAFSVALAGTDAYLAGECGLLQLDEGVWRRVAEWPGGTGALDLASAPDGTVWISNIDDDVRHWTGEELVAYDLRASGIEVTPDGAVWAVQYVRWEDAETESDEVMALRRLQGSEWILENDAVDSGYNGLATSPDGTLWAIEDRSRAADTLSLVSLDGDDWIPHDAPDGLVGITGFSADGGIIVALDGTTVDGAQIGAFAVRSGDSWTRYDLPTLEELQIPVAIEGGGELIDELQLRMSAMSNGTLWGHSGTGYGVFSFDGEEWTRFTTEDGLASNKITFVEIGPDGSLWFGTEDAGVTRYLPEQ
ncbi:MAG: hypothetical protein HKO63_08895 [Acidimicrobiia bacterium]|nr:hypothetical protein [Acidimicrobiia bacterium]NNL98306.1 hypothetical protein [Acidimicrobiia bacterium]